MVILGKLFFVLDFRRESFQSVNFHFSNFSILLNFLIIVEGVRVWTIGSKQVGRKTKNERAENVKSGFSELT